MEQRDGTTIERISLPPVTRVVETVIEIPHIQYVEQFEEGEQKTPSQLHSPPTAPKFHIIDRTIEIPKMTEKVVEVPHLQIIDKIVEVPEYLYKEKIVEVPRTVIQERVIPVPHRHVEEITVEIPDREFVKVLEDIVGGPTTAQWATRQGVETPVDVARPLTPVRVRHDKSSSTEIRDKIPSTHVASYDNVSASPIASCRLSSTQDFLAHVYPLHHGVGGNLERKSVTSQDDNLRQEERGPDTQRQSVVLQPPMWSIRGTPQSAYYRQVARYVMVPLPHYRPVPVHRIVNKEIPIPVELHVEEEILCPRVHAKYIKVPVDVPLPSCY